MSKTETVFTDESILSGHEVSALYLTGSLQDGNALLGTRDTYIWGALAYDLILAADKMQEQDIDRALEKACSIYVQKQKELLTAGFDFISYLHNRHIPAKDLVIEFVDYIFKHCRDDNDDHYLSYVYDIIGFIEQSSNNANDALSTLSYKGWLEETFDYNGFVTIDLIPTAYFRLTNKGRSLLDQITAIAPDSLPPAMARLLSMEPFIKKLSRIFFKNTIES